MGKRPGYFYEIPTTRHWEESFAIEIMKKKINMKKTRIILVIAMASVILLACLGLLGYFGAKTLRRTYYLRMDARKALAAEDWKNAQTLLKKYIEKDPDSEEDVIRLAQVYRHFDNAEEEMHCWYWACRLNPLKPEYWDNYIECAMKARSFPHLYSSLSRKLHSDEELTTRDTMLYLISAVMSDHVKDAEIDPARPVPRRPHRKPLVSRGRHERRHLLDL